MAAPKQSFLAAHWDWLVALGGFAALAAAGVYLVSGLSVSADQAADDFEAELNAVKPAHEGVPAADLSVLARASDTAKKPPALVSVDPKAASFLASESRVFCQKGDPELKGTACGRPIPVMNEKCPFCGMKQKVVKVEADTDHDCLPNDWEKQYGLNPNDASDAAKDADGDGFTNLEEFTAKTDPRDKLSHPDYMDYLALAGAVQDTRLDFYFKEAMKLPSGYRFRFQRLSRKDRNSSATYTALMDGEIATDEVNEKLREKSGWKVVGYEQKEEKMKIAGSQLTKNVDSSTVEIQRLSDGRKVKLVIVPNVKQFRNRVETDLESRIDIAWNRGDGLKFTVSEGTEFSIKERKYRVTKLKKTENGAEVTVQDLASKTEKILR